MSQSYQLTHHAIPEHLYLQHNHYESLNSDKERSVSVCARAYVCWNSLSTKYNTKSFAIAIESEEPTSDTNIVTCKHTTMTVQWWEFFVRSYNPSGEISFTLQVVDVTLFTYCLIHMPVSNKTLVQDIQSLVTFLVTVDAASLTVIYTPPSEVKECQNATDKLEVFFSSIIDILNSYMGLGLYSSKYEEWPSAIWHHMLRYV